MWNRPITLPPLPMEFLAPLPITPLSLNALLKSSPDSSLDSLSTPRGLSLFNSVNNIPLSPPERIFNPITIKGVFSHNEAIDEFRSRLQIHTKPFRQTWPARKAVTPAPGKRCIIKRKDIRLISLDAMTTIKLGDGVY